MLKNCYNDAIDKDEGFYMPLKEGEKLVREGLVQTKNRDTWQTVIVRKIENAPVTRIQLGRGDCFVELSTPIKPNPLFRYEVEPVNG